MAHTGPMRDRATQAAMKLADSLRHGDGCELFLVEGDSAWRSVAMLRQARTQAVLPLQGKPLNAWKASPGKVLESPLYRQLAEALGMRDPIGLAEGELPRLRYQRLLLLFDPDADGVHISALVLLYLERFARPLLDAGRVHLVRAPMFAIDAEGGRMHAYSRAHAQALLAQLQAQGDRVPQLHGYRGLGSIEPEALRALCIDPASRHSRVVGREDIAAIKQAFGIAG